MGFGFCFYCSSEYETATDGDIHTYTHLAEAMGRDYSKKLAELHAKKELERASKRR